MKLRLGQFPQHWTLNHPAIHIIRTSGWTPFRKLQRLTETPASSIKDHQFQYSNLRKVLCTPYHLGMRMNPCLRLKW